MVNLVRQNSLHHRSNHQYSIPSTPSCLHYLPPILGLSYPCACLLDYSKSVQLILALTGAKLSFHFKTLKDAQLVHSRQEERWIYCRLNLAQFIALEQYLSEYRRFSQLLPDRSYQDIPST